jgi:hypothetical protein
MFGVFIAHGPPCSRLHVERTCRATRTIRIKSGRWWQHEADLALEEIVGGRDQAASADDDRRSPASALAAVRVLTRSLRACA